MLEEEEEEEQKKGMWLFFPGGDKQLAAYSRGSQYIL